MSIKVEDVGGRKTTVNDPTGYATELAEGPAFREFFKLQEGFQWNGMCCALRAGRFN
jgi:hypothetical protein